MRLVPEYSWEHKDTSTLFTQKPLKNNYVPIDGNIDLMKYSNSFLASSLLRNVAGTEDVLGLLWLLGVKFDD